MVQLNLKSLLVHYCLRIKGNWNLGALLLFLPMSLTRWGSSSDADVKRLELEGHRWPAGVGKGHKNQNWWGRSESPASGGPWLSQAWRERRRKGCFTGTRLKGWNHRRALKRDVIGGQGVYIARSGPKAGGKWGPHLDFSHPSSGLLLRSPPGHSQLKASHKGFRLPYARERKEPKITSIFSMSPVSSFQPELLLDTEKDEPNNIFHQTETANSIWQENKGFLFS